MAVVTCNGSAVVAGTVHFPIRGRWYGRLETTDTTAPPVGTPVALQIGPDLFRGTVREALSDSGNRVTLTVVGGADALDLEATPRHYFSTTFGAVLKAVLGTETLALDSDQSVLALPLPHYVVTAGTVAETLKKLLAAASRLGGPSMASLVWRIDATGSVWIGPASWIPTVVDAVLVAEDPHRRSFTLALERASVRPGQTVRGHDLTDTTYTVTDRTLRALCTYGGTTQGFEAAQQAKLVRRETAHIDLYALYGFTVLAQNADGSLELRSLDSRLPDMSKVPLRTGLAGTTQHKVQPGTTAYLTHCNGDETKPMVIALDQGAGQGLTITHTGPVEITAPEVKAGGPAPLVLHDAMAGLWAALVSACAANTPPITVPPFVGCQTTITKGA